MLGPIVSGVAILLILGVPIFVSLGLPSVLGFAAQGIPLTVVTQRMFGGIDRFSLMAMPFFILAANIMGRGGMSIRIVRLANALVGRIYGGTALATTLGCMFFGALSGSSPATVAAIGGITKPMLDENKYDEKFSLGLIMASSSLAILIPPSITMIIYATITNVSVGQLFLAGIGPGVLMGVFYMIYSYWYARKNNLRSVNIMEENVSILITLKKSAWALGVPVIIIGGIYGGVFTPTESAVVASVYAVIVCIYVYRELDWKTTYKIALDSVVTTSQIMILVSAASVLSWLLTIEQIQGVVQGVVSWAQGVPWLVLLIINIIMLIVGMFLDPSSIILILGPLFVPLVAKLGVSPLHMGAIMVSATAIGMFSPPFGLNLFISKAVFKKDFSILAISALPWMAISIIAQLLITYIPAISLWLPKLAYGH